ncbi:MAG: hypothetical protein AAF290_16085 [Pseudomonadota bacterium]
MFISTLLLSLSLALAPTIPPEQVTADTSSAAAFDRSVQRMSADLDKEEQEKLLAAILTLRFSEIETFAVEDPNAALKAADQPEYYTVFEGMTRTEIIEFVPERHLEVHIPD